MRPVRPWILAAVTLLLFMVWSSSFIAVGYLVGADGGPRRLDWTSLTVARFLPAAAICGVWCFGFRRRETLAILRERPGRVLLCGVLVVPGYNLALYYGQQHGVPAPIASLTTTLVPLFVLVLAAVFLHERVSARKIVGFIIAVSGMALIAAAKKQGLAGAYPLLVAITALAPLCWSIYSVLSKPVAHRTSPIVWTYLVTTVGGALALPLLPGRAWAQWTALDLHGWLALLYLSIPCTVLGFALWTWLLRHMLASSVGFTVFLNPPLTTTSKYLLATLYPATFLFTIQAREWAGGLVTLAGLAVALWPARRAHRSGVAN